MNAKITKGAGLENISLKGEEVLLLGKQAEERSRVYMLLSAFYMQRPREDFVKKLKSLEFMRNLQKALLEGEGELKVGLKMFELFANSIQDVPESEVAESLAVEFTRLFRGVEKGYGPPPPYESVWRGEGKVMGEWTLEVLNKYHQARIGMDLQDELPDYIGVELKFMALLSYHEAEAWRKGDIQEAIRFAKLQQKFMDEHLCRWTSEFCNRMREDAVSSLYKGCAIITKEFLEMDREKIRNNPGER